MLTSLSIKNYALIETVQLSFKKGFTVITGETGAGKSILLGALGLITGKRADSGSAGIASEKCVVEGVFDIEAYSLQIFFEENDLDFETNTIVRRELLPSGKSRAFINDTPVTLSQLAILGNRLVDIHSQNKTLEVVQNDFQFEMLDTFSDNLKQLDSYKSIFNEWKKAQLQLKKRLEKQQKAQLEFDYQSFLFNELDEAKLVKGEFQQLEEELETLGNADEIMQQLANAVQKVSLEETGAIDQLSQARASLSRLSQYGSQYEELYNRLHSSVLELEDVSEALSEMSNTIDADPLKLERHTSRLQTLYSLMKKHQVDSEDKLLEVRDALDLQLQEVQGADNEIATLEKNIQNLNAKAVKQLSRFIAKEVKQYQH